MGDSNHARPLDYYNNKYLAPSSKYIYMDIYMVVSRL